MPLLINRGMPGITLRNVPLFQVAQNLGLERPALGIRFGSIGLRMLDETIVTSLLIPQAPLQPDRSHRQRLTMA